MRPERHATATVKTAAPPAGAAENHVRSLAKAVSWRVTGTVDTIIVSFLVTGRVKLAFSIGFIELFTKIFLYYLHERAWNKISFGRRSKSAQDYEI